MVRWLRSEARKQKRRARKNADPRARVIAGFLIGLAIEVEDADTLEKIKAVLASTPVRAA